MVNINHSSLVKKSYTFLITDFKRLRYKIKMVDFSYYQCLGLTMVWNWEVGNWSWISASTGPQVMLPHAWAFVASNHPSCYPVLKLQQASLPEPSTWKVPLILQNPAQMSPPLQDFSECLRERSHFWLLPPGSSPSLPYHLSHYTVVV